MQIDSTNPLKRFDAEMKRRADVLGIFPNEAAATSMVGALQFEQKDERSPQRRYLQLKGLQTRSVRPPARMSVLVS